MLGNMLNDLAEAIRRWTERKPPKGSPKVRTIRVKEKVLAKIPQNVLQPKMINVYIAASMVTLKGTVGS